MINLVLVQLSFMRQRSYPCSQNWLFKAVTVSKVGCVILVSNDNSSRLVGKRASLGWMLLIGSGNVLLGTVAHEEVWLGESQFLLGDRILVWGLGLAEISVYCLLTSLVLHLGEVSAWLVIFHQTARRNSRLKLLQLLLSQSYFLGETFTWWVKAWVLHGLVFHGRLSVNPTCLTETLPGFLHWESLLLWGLVCWQSSRLIKISGIETKISDVEMWGFHKSFLLVNLLSRLCVDDWTQVGESLVVGWFWR